MCANLPYIIAKAHLCDKRELKGTASNYPVALLTTTGGDKLYEFGLIYTIQRGFRIFPTTDTVYTPILIFCQILSVSTGSKLYNGISQQGHFAKEFADWPKLSLVNTYILKRILYDII